MVEAAMKLPSRSEVMPYTEQLYDAFRTYTGNVSPRSMAIPIETAAFLLVMCERTEAGTVADLGSGITSYVLRRYATEVDDGVIVHSVDDDPYWLTRSRDFCAYNQQDTAGFLSDTEWLDDDTRYDVIVHDLASGTKRNRFAEHAADRLNPGGIVIFDDAQNHGHHHHFAEVCRQREMMFLDVWHQTIDEIGRYAAMGVRL